MCPGGAQPPTPCKQGFIASQDFSECVCPNGQVDNGNGGCRDCSPGNYCIGGQENPCPNHYYQNLAAATSCMACAINDVAVVACSSNQQVKYCHQIDPSSQNQILTNNCVSCSICTTEFYYKTLNPQYSFFTVDQLVSMSSDVTFCYKPYVGF